MTALSTGKYILATRNYKMVLENLYGIMAGNIDLNIEFNRYMMIRALEWNDGYLTTIQVRCLESKIQRPNKPCNC